MTVYNGSPVDLTPAQRWANWAKETAAQDAWDAVAQQAAAALPGQALYLRTDSVFAPGGNFLTWMRTANGTWVRARKLDNTHFCPYGAAELGALVTEDLTPVLHLAPMTPGGRAARGSTRRTSTIRPGPVRLTSHRRATTDFGSPRGVPPARGATDTPDDLAVQLPVS